MQNQSIWSKLFTALRGGASEVGEAIADQQALRILDQEIRDADNALANAKRELVTIMAKHKLSAERVAQYNAKIKDLESKAMAAIQANREDLALEVAEAISTLTNELDAEQKQTTEFGAYADKMRKDITKAEARIKSLRQQVDMAKARESVQKAQVSASIASGGANGKLETAVSTLNRLQAKQEQRAAELEASDELADASTGNDLERKLREAGITPDQGSANAILDRLKKQSAE
ncbi:PspA/IM30 family protein [Pseudomonas sp. NPDC087697]|uniref:PspA/IM30 family protein n=1 Tax=Pseudomonas sp. NPDC087697 TaxID=3364447 RepID=UPI0037FB6C24